MSKQVIICVDDETTVLRSLRVELQEAIGNEYLIEMAQGGEEALDLIEELLEAEYEIPLIISDYIMPNMKGDELLKRVHMTLPKTLKILLTGQADLEAVGKAIQYAKLYRYIAKPWQAEDLSLTVKEAVNSYLQDKKLAQQNAKLQLLNQELEQSLIALEASHAQMKALNQALSESESRLAQFLDAMPVGVFVTEANGKPYYINQTGQQILGQGIVESVTTEQFQEVYLLYLAGSEQLYPKERDPVVNALKGESVTVDDMEIRRPDKIIPIESLGTPIYDESGNITYAIAAFRDITKRKQAEKLLAEYNRTLEAQVSERTQELSQTLEHLKATQQELIQAKEAAECANRAKSEFLSKMSHELRSPLNAILGFTQVLARDNTLKLVQHKQLEIIKRSGEHLLSLINDVLEMSKIEAGRTTLNENKFDLYRLLSSLQEMLHLKAHSKGLQLTFNYSPDTPRYVRTDESKLRQILINLIGNAIKFTSSGGVTLRVGRSQKSDVTSDKRESVPDSEVLSPDSFFLHFEVEDTGPGIAADELDTLFEPFVQTKTGKMSQEGTGLGLPITRQFVQLMGGNITVSSTVGEGTIFKFDLKVTLAQAGEVQTAASTRQAIALAPNQPTYRILVVDDRGESRQLLLHLLSRLGIEVREAENGQEAVALWDSWQPHLILMDMRMPVMDGYEATKQIKSHLKGQATVIIALTASAFEEDRTMILSAGCDDFVRKPFQEEVLLEKIATHLGVRYVYEESSRST
jgi:PAS domain S-box-containing protein